MASAEGSNSSGKGISDTLKQLDESLGGEEEIALGDIVAAFGRKSFGPMILLPALLSLIPLIGGIPGVSIITATWILLVAVQMPFRRTHLWLPHRLMGWKVSGEKFSNAARKSLPWIERGEKLLGPRLFFLSRPPGSHLADVAVILGAIMMYPLNFIPYAVTLPSLALVLMSAGLMANDGLVLLIGFAATIGSAAVAWFMVI